ncbi:MAG: hypothetical protein Fur0011_3380 [Candidatus Microgenomates bacterium]
MKQFLIGVVTVLLLVVAGVLAFGGVTGLFGKLFPTPSASPFASATPMPTVTPTPSATAKPSAVPTANSKGATTKGGLVKGISNTTTKKVVTTTSHLMLTLVETSICPVSYTTEVKDITGPLTLRYELIDNTSFGITIWKKDGNELLPNTTYGGRRGTITTISGVDYMKVRVESKSCASNNDNWLKLTAER